MGHLSLIYQKAIDIRCASWHNTMVNWCQLQEMYQNCTWQDKNTTLQGFIVPQFWHNYFTGRD